MTPGRHPGPRAVGLIQFNGAPACRRRGRAGSARQCPAGPGEVPVVAEPGQRLAAGRVHIAVGDRAAASAVASASAEQRADPDRAPAAWLTRHSSESPRNREQAIVHGPQLGGEQSWRPRSSRSGSVMQQRGERAERGEGADADGLRSGRHHPPPELRWMSSGAARRLGRWCRRGGGRGEGRRRRAAAAAPEPSAPLAGEASRGGRMVAGGGGASSWSSSASATATVTRSAWPLLERGGRIRRVAVGRVREQGREANRGDRAELGRAPGQLGQAAQALGALLADRVVVARRVRRIPAVHGRRRAGRWLGLAGLVSDRVRRGVIVAAHGRYLSRSRVKKP